MDMSRRDLQLEPAPDYVSSALHLSCPGMLKLNLRESRDMLARRLREATMPAAAHGEGTGSPASSLVAARREAQVLVDEVDAQFFAA